MDDSVNLSTLTITSVDQGDTRDTRLDVLLPAGAQVHGLRRDNKEQVNLFFRRKTSRDDVPYVHAVRTRTPRVDKRSAARCRRPQRNLRVDGKGENQDLAPDSGDLPYNKPASRNGKATMPRRAASAARLNDELFEEEDDEVFEEEEDDDPLEEEDEEEERSSSNRSSSSRTTTTTTTTSLATTSRRKQSSWTLFAASRLQGRLRMTTLTSPLFATTLGQSTRLLPRPNQMADETEVDPGEQPVRERLDRRRRGRAAASDAIVERRVQEATRLDAQADRGL